MYVLWSKQYQVFYDEYKGLVEGLRKNPNWPKTRYLNKHFRDIFKHLDLSRLTLEQQNSFDQIIQQMSFLLNELELVEDDQAVSTVDADRVKK